MDNSKIYIRSEKSPNSPAIEFDNRLRNFSSVVYEIDETNKLDADIAVDVLNVIKKFYELHGYEKSSMEIKTPLTSDKLSDHIDKKSYSLFKEYEGYENAEKIKPLVDAAYYFNLEDFKKMCLLTLGAPFFIGTTEADKDKYKEKWGIGDLSPDEERVIINENTPVFEKINEVFKKKMEEEQKRFEAQLDEDEQHQQQDGQQQEQE